MECGAMWQELVLCGPPNRACYSPDSFRRFLGAIEAIEAFLGHILLAGRRHGRLNNRDHVPFVPFLSPLLARV